MVRRQVCPEEQQPNMQYPPPGPPPPDREGNQGPSYKQYQYGAPPTQFSPPRPYEPSPYAAERGENSSYYGIQGPPSQGYQQPWGQQQNGAPPQNQYYNTATGQQQYGAPQQPQHYIAPPDQQQYRPPQEAYGSQPPAQPYDQASALPSYRPPQIRQEDHSNPSGPVPQTDEERGLMGALAGGAAGGYAGHKMHHGLLGAIGGAYAGHKLEDAYKDHKKHSRPSSPNPQQPPPAYQHHDTSRMGNFSHSSKDISLDGDYDLIASCSAINGHRRLSSISLNSLLTNDNGHFRWVMPGSETGNFGASARNVRLVDEGSVLEAELCCCDGSWRTDRIRLDDRIENSNGDLRAL